MKTLDFTKRGRVAIATFDRPKQLNAIDAQRLSDLESLLSFLEADTDLGAVILTGGTASSYCVGLDLDLLDRAFADVGYFEQVVRRLGAIVTRLEALPVPTIAAVNGWCRAGGFELSMGCDFILMADEAKIGDVHTDAGVLPAMTSKRLVRRIGEQQAKLLIWSGRWLSGPEAVACGLALKSVPLAALPAAALALADEFSAKPGPCIAASKSVFQRIPEATLAEGVETELGVFVHYMRTQPYGREGYAAYREGRLPAWKAAATA